MRAFDIKIVDENDPSHVYAPQGEIRVAVTLVDSGLSKLAQVNVVHFADAETVRTVDAPDVDGDTVAFVTDHFSVYVVNGTVHTPTFYFYTLNEYLEYEQRWLNTDTENPAYMQIVREGETPVAPQNPVNPQDQEATFAGWYRGGANPADPQLWATPYDFSAPLTLSEDDVVYLYVKFSHYVYVIFHDEYDADSDSFPVAFTRRMDLLSENEEDWYVNVDQYTVSYKDPLHEDDNQMVFFGWSDTPIRTPGASLNDYGGPVEKVLTDEGRLTVTETTHLYPIFAPVRWLSFYSGPSGSRATFFTDKFYLNGVGPESLPGTDVMSRNGNWDFEGWYINATLDSSGETDVTGATKIANADGSLIAGVSDAALGIEVVQADGVTRLQLNNSSTVTLYANWTVRTTSHFTVIVRREKATDNPDMTDDQKSYEYAERFVITGLISDELILLSDLPSELGSLNTLAGYNAMHPDAPLSSNDDNPYSGYGFNLNATRINNAPDTYEDPVTHETIAYVTIREDGSIPTGCTVLAMEPKVEGGRDCALYLKDAAGNRYELADMTEEIAAGDSVTTHKIYYLFYPLLTLYYVLENADGSLSLIGDDGNAATPAGGGFVPITYEGQPLTMNGQPVTQTQGVEVPLDGLTVSQSVGGGNFNIPPLLDRGEHALDLVYYKMGAIPQADRTVPVSDIRSFTDTVNDSPVSGVTETLTLYTQVHDNLFSWRFADEDEFVAINQWPVVYAIYRERGYSLTVSKTVPVDTGYNEPFTVTVESTAINREHYTVTGTGYTQISAVPAQLNEHDQLVPGTGIITFDVKDGDSITVVGLAPGDYTVTETGSENFVLTAQKTVGENATPEEATVTDGAVTITLEANTEIDLINTPMYICKIGNRKFHTLTAAIDYIIAYSANFTETVEMLVPEYLMPQSDTPEIPSYLHVTLTTADPDGEDPDNLIAEGQTTVIRRKSNVTRPMLNSLGELTLTDVELDGNSGVGTASAATFSVPMINNEGTLHIGSGAVLHNAATEGDGAAIYSYRGAIDVSGGEIYDCTAARGGAIYAASGTVSVSDGALYDNVATEGGAIYYAGSDTLTVSDGAIGASGHANTAERGAAIYMASGTANLTGSTVGKTNNAANANTAQNGSAVFVYSSTLTIKDGAVKGNVASNGGAIGFGSADARLNLYNGVQITENTMNGAASNVYLNFDTDAIINFQTLSSSANVGIYVSDDPVTVDGESTTVLEQRGVPNARFGVYVNNNVTSNRGKIHNDRTANLIVGYEATNKKLYWIRDFTVKIYYVADFTRGLPFGGPDYTNNFSTSSGSNGGQFKKQVDETPPEHHSPVIDVAADLRTKSGVNLTNTSVFGSAFVQAGSVGSMHYTDYLTDINWNTSDNLWEFVKLDGTPVQGGSNPNAKKTRIFIYTEPYFLSIENNARDGSSLGLTLVIDGLTVTVNGTAESVVNNYGYLYAKNDEIQDDLRPVQASDLVLGYGESVCILLPGGKGMDYALTGTYYSTYDPEDAANNAVASGSVDFRQRVTTESNLATGTVNAAAVSVSGGQAKTPSVSGQTHELIFGGDKAICRVVVDAQIIQDGVPVSTGFVDEHAGEGVTAGKYEYTFSSPKQANAFIMAHHAAFTSGSTVTATIEMLMDYMMPASEQVNLTTGGGLARDITFRTAVDGYFRYDPDNTKADGTGTQPRAKVSRASGNLGSFITAPAGTLTNGDYVDTLTVENLIFDGKSFGGNNIGRGIIDTNGWNVEIDTVDFNNCQARYGGGVFIKSVTPKSGNQTPYGHLTVRNSTFYNCQSLEKDTDKYGGGGIWTSMKTLTVEDCSFITCFCERQGGGLFHFVCTTGDYESYTNIDGCTFENCYALNGTGSNGNGGAMRSTAKYNTITGCTFTNNIGNDGGVYFNRGVLSADEQAGVMRISGGSISRCTAVNGGVYLNGSNAQSGITRRLYMSGGSISGNSVTGEGGGIYAGDEKVRIYFSGAPYVYRNVSESADLPNSEVVPSYTNASNVQMNRDFIGNREDDHPGTVIVARGLIRGATVGVHVPGADNNDNATSLYDRYGGEMDPFATFEDNDRGLNYFVNDRNGMKGGKLNDQSTTDKKIYWRIIYALSVTKHVLSDDPADNSKYFRFTLQLTGTISGGEAPDTRAEDINGRYGDLTFTNGRTAFTLVNGETKTADLLPLGFGYEINEVIVQAEDRLRFKTSVENWDGTVTQGTTVTGTMLEPAHFSYAVTFSNLHAVCKITDDQGRLLYTQGSDSSEYRPAVYSVLVNAFNMVNAGTDVAWYYKDEMGTFERAYPNVCNIEMLIPEYEMEEPAAWTSRSPRSLRATSPT